MKYLVRIYADARAEVVVEAESAEGAHDKALYADYEWEYDGHQFVVEEMDENSTCQ